jgi:hypothetical protein
MLRERQVQALPGSLSLVLQQMAAQRTNLPAQSNGTLDEVSAPYSLCVDECSMFLFFYWSNYFLSTFLAWR